MWCVSAPGARQSNAPPWKASYRRVKLIRAAQSLRAAFAKSCKDPEPALDGLTISHFELNQYRANRLGEHHARMFLLGAEP